MEKSTLIQLLLFFTILDIGTSYKILCPDKKKLQPCTCIEMAYGLLVKCADFSDTQLFVNALKNLHDYNVQSVVLHNLMLKSALPKDLFEGQKICEIAVRKCNLTFLQPAFKGLDQSLQVLNINEHSIITGSEKFDLARLTSLMDLTMKRNPVGKILENSWLKGKLPSVEKIRLEENEITKIGSRAFADMPQLRSIIISGNRINAVKRSMFPKPAEHLTVIDLSDNELRFLPEDFFSEMPALKEVLLPGNDLQSLPEVTWGRVWNRLKSVLLFNNKLTCDSDLNWIPKAGWPEILEAVCVAPSALVGKDLKDVYDILT